MESKEIYLSSIARQAIETNLKDTYFQPKVELKWEGELGYDKVAGIFVTLHKKTDLGDWQLRGCIGRHCRQFEFLADETRDCAILSAFKDPRFPQLKLEELKQVKIEISLLNSPQPVLALSELDPLKWGLILISKSNPNRQATLLPEIEGVDDVATQIEILKRKAGIARQEDFILQKFSIQKLSEANEM